VKGIKHTLSSQMEQRILNAWSSWVQRRISWPQGTVLYGHFLVQKESYPVVIFCPKRTVPGGIQKDFFKFLKIVVAFYTHYVV